MEAVTLARQLDRPFAVAARDIEKADEGFYYSDAPALPILIFPAVTR
jgi:hypothetical protein